MTNTDKQKGNLAAIDNTAISEVDAKDRPGFFGNCWLLIKHTFSLDKTEPAPETKKNMKVYELDEIKALYRYVVDKGIGVKPELIGDLARLIILVDREVKERNKDTSDVDANVTELLKCYSELTTITYPTLGVSGRTIRDSARFSEGAISQAGVWGVAFFILALIPDALYLTLNEDSQLWGVTSFFVSLSP